MQKGDDNMMYPKQKVTIKQIKRHPMSFCNSRQMDIWVITKDGNTIHIPWADMPSVLTAPAPAKSTSYFGWFWKYAEEGTVCYLWHGKDTNCNYLEPLFVS